MTPSSPIAEPATPGDEHEQWIRDRLGKLTASRMADVIGQTKKGEYKAARRTYMIELIAERLTSMAADSYLSSSMLWGIEHEPCARWAYESKFGETVTKTGFVDHPVIPNCGASPDGLVGYDGLVEFKCPETRTHVGYLIGRVVPEDYLPQMHWQMACTGRAWCDFVSFDDRGTMPIELSIFRVRLMRDEAMIKMLEKEAIKFLSDMAFAIEAIESGHIESSDV